MAINNGLNWFRKWGAPVTVSIIASLVVAAFAFWFSAGKGMEYLVLTDGWQARPWTLLTYPWGYTPFFDGLSLFLFVCLCMWMFFVGSQTERDLGTAKYIGLWLVMIALAGLLLALLGPLTGKPFLIYQVWIPEAGITVVWCVRNPTATIRLVFGMVPVSGKWLAWITAGITILLVGAGNPLLGVIGALHLIVAWAFAANRIPFWTYSQGSFAGRGGRVRQDAPLKKHERMNSGYFDDVKKREKEREERERLRKLFESSLNDDAGNDR